MKLMNIRIKIIINYVKKAIYNVLFNHFDAPPKTALVASLLDPRFKKMRGWPDEIQLSTISLLREEYLLIKDEETTDVTQINTNTRFAGGFKSRLFGSDEVNDVDDDEINCYLDDIRT